MLRGRWYPLAHRWWLGAHRCRRGHRIWRIFWKRAEGIVRLGTGYHASGVCRLVDCPSKRAYNSLEKAEILCQAEVSQKLNQFLYRAERTEQLVRKRDSERSAINREGDDHSSCRMHGRGGHWTENRREEQERTTQRMNLEMGAGGV